jgi:hypothetical protein
VKQPTQNYQKKIEKTAASKQTKKSAGNFAKLLLCRKKEGCKNTLVNICFQKLRELSFNLRIKQIKSELTDCISI